MQLVLPSSESYGSYFAYFLTILTFPGETKLKMVLCLINEENLSKQSLLYRSLSSHPRGSLPWGDVVEICQWHYRLSSATLTMLHYGRWQPHWCQADSHDTGYPYIWNKNKAIKTMEYGPSLIPCRWPLVSWWSEPVPIINTTCAELLM